ncbi:MAG: MMPL family transporter [Actinobacteria bacterium]|nr:MMPL family transporter [Actinomycetota bacterium]
MDLHVKTPTKPEGLIRDGDDHRTGPGDTPSSRDRGNLLARLGRFSARRRLLVVLVWLGVTLVAGPLALSLNGAMSGAGWEAQGSTAQVVRDELRRDFPDVGAESAIVTYTQSTPIVDDPSGLGRLVAALADVAVASSVLDPLNLSSSPGSRMISPDGKVALIPVDLVAGTDAERPEAAGKLIAAVRGVSLPSGARADVTGEWPVWSDFNDLNERALHKAELFSALPTILLLFVAFGTVIAAGLPLMLALAGIAVGYASLHLLTGVTPLSVWSMNFSMMIGLAVGIDYSLFIVSRYREERESGRNAEDAIAATLSTAGKAVFLSGITVVLSLAAVFVVPVMVFRSMALGMILSVLAVSIASLTLLPAILVTLGDRVLVEKGEQDPDRAAEGRWVRWTGLALRRPAATLGLGLALLLGLGAPAFGMRLGMPGARVVDRGESSRDGYDTVTTAFGPGAAAPLFVTVSAGVAERVVAVISAEPNVADVRVVSEPAGSGRTAVRVTPGSAVDDPATSDLIGRLRSVMRREFPDALVGGPAAQNYDLTAGLVGRAPIAIALIMLVAFVLLLVVFRSLPIAIMSILLNLVGVAASFGFATMVFQHGWGASLLGIEHQGFVDAWAPLFFFALLFGLSMDYQLFLLAAIKERYEQTGDAGLAVREGIARTGRPITNAALIMIIVFIAFGVTGPIPPTELGVTLALAIMLDATVIRMMLMPSLLGMLGERAWWVPTWLGRLLPKVEFSH